MNDTQPAGGAGPALAAHSKDGQPHEAGGFTENVTKLAGEGMERAKASVREAAGSVRETLAGPGGRAVDEATGFVREQPLVALAVTGAICLAFGLLLGRR